VLLLMYNSQIVYAYLFVIIGNSYHSVQEVFFPELHFVGVFVPTSEHTHGWT